MNIINAVECYDTEVLMNVIESYLEESDSYKVVTDNFDIKTSMDKVYGKSKCVYNRSLAALWFSMSDKAMLVITDIDNVCSDIYSDLSKNYTISCIEGMSVGGV